MTDTQLQAVVDALSAYGIKLQAVPVATPTPTFQESGDRAQVLLGSPAIIVDAIGNKWTIANDGTVQLNGSHAGNSANAVLIYYFGHKLWHQNKEGNYYSWNGTGWTPGTPGVVAVPPPVIPSTPNPAPTPVVTSVRAAFVNYLNSIKGKHAISGQFVERGAVGPVVDIQTSTGKFLGILGFDCYWFNQGITAGNADGSWAQAAINHMTAGGLCTLSLSMPNPQTGGGCEQGDPCDFGQLIMHGSQSNTAFNRMLDQIAVPLLAVQQAHPNKPFMFRLWHENNGGWFWWGQGNANDAQFRAAWAYVYDYMVSGKGLTNLVWVNAQNAGGANPSRVNVAMTDMVGIDGYTSNPAQLKGDFDAIASLGKPLMLCEFGSGSPSVGDTNFQLTTLIDALKGPLNNVVAWLNWWDGNSQAGWGMKEEQNVKAALNDPYVLNRGDINM